jgi:hypothetical protein
MGRPGPFLEKLEFGTRQHAGALSTSTYPCAVFEIRVAWSNAQFLKSSIGGGAIFWCAVEKDIRLKMQL